MSILEGFSHYMLTTNRKLQILPSLWTLSQKHTHLKANFFKAQIFKIANFRVLWVPQLVIISDYPAM